MIEIIPNWHPIFVHFTVALFCMATGLYALSLLISNRMIRDQWLIVARWNLWFGMGLTVLTLLSGIYAYNTVVHDTPSHIAMTDHRNWAIATAALFSVATLWSVSATRAGREVSSLFVVLLVVATLILGSTAWRGGELVYRFGLGVMSLPKTGNHDYSGESEEHAHNSISDKGQHHDIDEGELTGEGHVQNGKVKGGSQYEVHDHPMGSPPHAH